MYGRDRFERRVRSGVRVTMALIVLKVALISAIIIYLVANPGVIGEFFGSIVAAFQEAVQ